ncbi:MAG: ATP-binding protein [Bacteroidota bacterium]
MIKRIAITGPESTGKSWLAEQLSMHFHTTFASEYARVFLAELKRPYIYDDILLIAQGQRLYEINASVKAEKFLFCDTEAVVTKIWSEHTFGRCDSWILNEIEHNPHDYYLLCNIDLPWEPDPLREHPNLREYLFNLYVNELTKRDLPYGIVSGQRQDRKNCAISLLSQSFKI